MKPILPIAFIALFSCSGAAHSRAADALTTASPVTVAATRSCTAIVPNPAPTNGPAPVTPEGLQVPRDLHIQRIAAVPGARELAFSPNGDLFVGTESSSLYIVPNADANARAGAPAVFATLPDDIAAGVAFSGGNCTIYVGTEFGVYRIAYHMGDQHASSSPVKIASVRVGGAGGHSTTSVAVSGSTLYASVGSSCNSCVESDPTRATVQEMHLDGSNMTTRAKHIRNAIGLSVNTNTGTVWAGDAGQDALPQGHPYEFFDPVTKHAGVPDYGWPKCEENHNAFGSGADCAATVAPLVEFPAYSTIIGTTFVPASNHGSHALPARFNGGAFVSMHGSWHAVNGISIAPPRIAFVPMHGDTPVSAVDWSTPTRQWSNFVWGFQTSSGSRIGRATGVAIGPQGDLFFADDQNGAIYRVRP
ncbi:MAG: hypothetical protein JO165_09895 [Candidatus Eremiobacteraeota bacterium]|nr:hypothetical protein [Candidatus Eremiobacteraeota bacterium]